MALVYGLIVFIGAGLVVIGGLQVFGTEAAASPIDARAISNGGCAIALCGLITCGLALIMVIKSA